MPQIQVKLTVRKLSISILAILCLSLALSATYTSEALADTEFNGGGSEGGAIWDKAATTLTDSSGGAWKIAAFMVEKNASGISATDASLKLAKIRTDASGLPRTSTDSLYQSFALTLQSVPQGYEVRVYLDAGDASSKHNWDEGGMPALTYWVEYADGSTQLIKGILGDTQYCISSLRFCKAPVRLTVAVDSSFNPATASFIDRAAVSVKDRAYTGKTLKPSSITVKAGGKTLKRGIDYVFSCAGGKKIGVYKVTITGKGAYAGTKTAIFKIVPKKVAVKKPAAAKRGFTAKWKALSKAQIKQITGYKVQWSTDKKFKKGVKSKNVSVKKTSLKVTKLKAKKTYYVRVCAYKKIGKTTCASAWSKVYKVKTK